MEIMEFCIQDLEELALFAERLNAHRETGSAFCCARAEDIRRDFEESIEYGFACRADGRLLGLISCFPDMEKRNADCSLLLEVCGADYGEAAGALVGAAREKMGSGLACTFYFPMENKECRRFLERTGARRQVDEYLLVLQKEDWAAPFFSAGEPRPLGDGEMDAFAMLHDTIFPGAYASGRDILEELGKKRSVYVISDGQGLAAYGVLKARGGKVAAVEMIGVREDARRCGYGRAMLNHLAGEAFLRSGAESLDLVVDADNGNALKLYLDTGFRIRQENNCYILR